MIIVTGGAGFIGSAIIERLNQISYTDIIVVDDLTPSKEKNLKNLKYVELISTDEFYSKFDQWSKIDAVFHEGAISSTTERNEDLINKFNLQPSYWLVDNASNWGFVLSYASSASVYGDSLTFKETDVMNPQSLYATSKMMLDNYVSSTLLDRPDARIQGWRYFNVYGNNESHKGNQASPVYKFKKQAEETNQIKVFKNSENFLRDFICVSDIANIKIDSVFKNHSGILNLGTGNAISFLDVANCIKADTDVEIIEIDFPDELKNQYQKYTCADTTLLKKLIGEYKFKTVSEFCSTTEFSVQ